MATLTKNKLGLSVILVLIVCFVSFPGLTMAASVQHANYQDPHNPFSSVVQNADFSVYAYPLYSSINAGLSVNTTIMVAARYGFNGTVSLSASAPAGWAAVFAQSSLSLTNGYSGYYGFYSYGGGSNWSQLSITVPSGASTGKYPVTVTGTNGSLTHSVNVTVNVVTPDFRISAHPSRTSVTAGTTWNSTIILASLYKFSGTVSLSASAPAGWAAVFVPSSLPLTDGYYNSSQLSVTVPSGAAVGKTTIVVTGTSGSLSHSTNVTVNVVTPDFWINAYPSRTSVTAGTTWNSTIILASLYGFSGSVSLSASFPAGWAATFVPSSLPLTGSSYNWSQLSVAVPSGAAAGKYTIVVTGTSGSLTHSVNVTVNVVTPDFQINAFSSHSVAAGSTANSTILVASLYGFNGTVSLSASVPTGWSASFAPSSLSVTNAYSGYYYYGNSFNCSKLSVAVPSGTAAGKYTIVVTGASGLLIHSANVTVTVK